jgi:hypothetical protein
MFLFPHSALPPPGVKGKGNALGLPSLQSHEKQISALYKLPSLWHSAEAAKNGPRQRPFLAHPQPLLHAETPGDRTGLGVSQGWWPSRRWSLRGKVPAPDSPNVFDLFVVCNSIISESLLWALVPKPSAVNRRENHSHLSHRLRTTCKIISRSMISSREVTAQGLVDHW